ncbi:MAG: hypothetical protein GXY49_12605 [Syntrophomonadaceae bacterium]|nr:hypothetical protein [Syntrophomonadaceae bacterium]
MNTKFKKRIFGSVLAGSLLISGVMVVSGLASSEAEYSSKEEAAEGYIASLRDGEYGLFSGFIGTVAYQDDEGVYMQDAAEKAGLFSNPTGEGTKSTAELTKAQAAFVCENFGANAWNNIKYTFTKWAPPGDRTAYIIEETGEEVSFEVYLETNQKYWEEIAINEGIEVDEIFAQHLPGEKLTDDEIHATGVYQKYVADEPAVLTTAADFECYIVELSFHQESADGTKNYRFYVSNEDGTWGIYQGLTWDASECLPTEGNSD